MSLLHRPRVLSVFPPTEPPRRGIGRLEIEWLVSRPALRRASIGVAPSGPECRLMLQMTLADELPLNGLAASGRIATASMVVTDPVSNARILLVEDTGVRGCASIDAAGWLRWSARAATTILGIGPVDGGLLLSEGLKAAGSDVATDNAPDAPTCGSGPLYVRSGVLGALGIPGGRYEVLGLRTLCTTDARLGD